MIASTFSNHSPTTIYFFIHIYTENNYKNPASMTKNRKYGFTMDDNIYIVFVKPLDRNTSAFSLDLSFNRSIYMLFKIFERWNTTQQKERRSSYPLQQHGWNWRALC